MGSISKIEKADEYFKNAQYLNAIEIYKVILDDCPEKLNIPEIYRKLGNCYFMTHNISNALEIYEKLLDYVSDNSQLYTTLAYLYYYADIDKAIEYYKKAIELKPDNIYAIVNLSLSILKSDKYSQILIKEQIEQFINNARPLIVDSFKYKHEKNIKNINKKLRVGYLSSDFYSHAVMQFILPLFKNHDTDKFDFYLYSTSDKFDVVTDEIKNLNMKFILCDKLNNKELAHKIYNDHIDILVDLSGFTHCQSLCLLYKPAPIQIQYLGFLNTMGMNEVDYLISDKELVPCDMQKYYTEKLLYLGNCISFQYDIGNRTLPPIKPLPYLNNGYITFGSFNCPSKFNDFIIELWAKILNKVPNSKLLIYRTHMSDISIKIIKNKFEKLGIDINRIIFDNSKPESSFFDKYGDVDIALDTYPFNGLTTMLELMLMGVPTITLQGESMQSRTCYKINHLLGFDELIATNDEEYINSAYNLAMDIEKLKKYRNILRHKLENSPIMTQSKHFANSLEDLYIDVWKKYCK